MTRIAARVERPIKIHRMEGRLRYLVDVQDGFNLPDAIKRWYEAHATRRGYYDPEFQANTVTIRTINGHEELYVATD